MKFLKILIKLILAIIFPGFFQWQFGKYKSFLIFFLYSSLFGFIVFNQGFQSWNLIFFISILIMSLAYYGVYFYFTWPYINNYSHKKHSNWWFSLHLILQILIFLIPTRSEIQSFKIPSGSMIPTLNIGDRLLMVNEKNNNQINRGDIIIFWSPIDSNIRYIKRVIGLPGDKIKIDRKEITVNDKLFKYKNSSLNEIHIDQKFNHANFEHLIENNHHRSYSVLYDNNVKFRLQNLNQIITVPESQYFVMGDNRDYSSDSRVWGLVSKDKIIGKARFIFWSPFFDKIGTILNEK